MLTSENEVPRVGRAVEPLVGRGQDDRGVGRADDDLRDDASSRRGSTGSLHVVAAVGRLHEADAGAVEGIAEAEVAGASWFAGSIASEPHDKLPSVSVSAVQVPLSRRHTPPPAVAT